MNSKTFFIMGAVLLCALFLCGQNDKDYEYAIDAKDLLEMSVFDVPDLNITVRVSEDGSITLPLLGRVDVKGLTRSELEKRIAALLEKSYLKNPQVTVFIKEYQSKKVSVVGAIKNSGSYELIGRQSLLQIISIAGGLTAEATDRIIIIRQMPDGKSSSLVIPLEELILKGNAKYNIPLLPGDIVNIPAERFADIYVFGQVKNPGLVRMPKSSNATLLRAIAQAGGFAERAATSSVTVTRMVDGKESKFKVNVRRIVSGKDADFLLAAGDLIFIPESLL